MNRHAAAVDEVERGDGRNAEHPRCESGIFGGSQAFPIGTGTGPDTEKPSKKQWFVLKTELNFR